MRSYTLRRLLYLLPILLAVSVIAFWLANLAPGDPAEMVLRRGGQEPTPEAVAALRQELGLNDPAPVRYLAWLGKTLTGDLGYSYQNRRPVLNEIAAGFPTTFALASLALTLTIALALPLGLFSAARPGSFADQLGRGLALVFTSLPSFVLALGLIYLFAVTLRWLPTGGATSPTHFILPAVALSLRNAGSLLRLTRASLLETLGKDFVRTAHAKGLAPRSVLTRHVLKNSLLPVVTAAGLSFGELLGGAAVIETIFSLPGLGKLTVDAIFDRDYPMIQGFVLLSGVFFVLVNLGVDLLYRRIDPRLRLGVRHA
jgi:peptide/nickel transport system permease protein